MKDYPVRYMFMHTVNGQPAFFDGDQIALFPKGRHFVRALVSDMDTIRKQRGASIRWRRAMSFDVSKKVYGVVRIEIV